jgi:hypothetical protein
MKFGKRGVQAQGHVPSFPKRDIPNFTTKKRLLEEGR